MVIPDYRSADIRDVDDGVLPAEIPIGDNALNVLPQVRKHLGNGDIDDLAESILKKGQKVRGFVVARKERAARRYLDEVNVFWGTGLKLRNMRKCIIDGEEYYLFLVFGHRRYKAAKLALKRLSEGDKSTVFTGGYRCNIHFDLTFKSVFPIQLLENMYVPPPKDEEIAALWRYWRFLQKYEPGITIAAFARQVGRKPKAVRDMLRFCGLPEGVQRMIRPDAPGGKASYSMLLQVARLYEARELNEKPMSDREVLRFTEFHISRRTKASDLAREVSSAIRDLVDGQEDLFGGNTVEIEKRLIRKVAAGNMVTGLYEFLRWLHVIHDMMHDGESFGALSPYFADPDTGDKGEFSPHSAANIAVRFIVELKRAVPDFVHMVNKDGRSAAKLQSALFDLGIEEAVLNSLVAEDA